MGGGSGGIASARRAAEFGVKVDQTLSTMVTVDLLGFLPPRHFPAGGSRRGKSPRRNLRQRGMRPQETHVVRRKVVHCCAETDDNGRLTSRKVPVFAF